AQVVEGLPDLAGIEGRVRDPVQLRVFERTGDRLLGDLDAPNRQRVTGEREADRPDPAVQVVDALLARQAGELARELVEALGHRGVRLKKRVWAHPEP